MSFVSFDLRTLLRRACVLMLSALAMASAARVASAQEPRDTTRAAADSTGPRPERRPPVSPKRAFLYSLLMPGYSQSVLGRNRAGALQLAFESAALVMIRQSAADVREARRMLADSIPVSFIDETGVSRIRYERTPFSSALVRSRRAHLEDWIAVLFANHLFSAADGYVAALLWDLPGEVQMNAAPRSAGLSLRFRW